MPIGDIFKISKYKQTIKQLEEANAKQAKTLKEQLSILTDEHVRAIGLQQYIYELEEKAANLDFDNNQKQMIIKEKEEQLSTLVKNYDKATSFSDYIDLLNNKVLATEKILSDKSNLVKEIENKISSMKSEIVELDETLLLQDFGLYHPTYNFATSAEYKEKLDSNRNIQKQMIKDKKAAVCSTDWAVNNSKRAGQKMINDNIKQTILTFNTECENAIDRVKFNNFESMKNRIVKIYDKLNKLNSSLCIEISPDFLNLKLDELTLAHEYAQKKQEEKEYIREQREIQREEARVQKELENERKRIEKERSHYENQMERLVEQLENESNSARKELIREKIDAVKEELLDLDKALKDVDYRQANDRAGYVYIISNIGAFGEGVYKIGMTRRLEPMDRIDELGGASVPFKFDVHALIFSADAPKL